MSDIGVEHCERVGAVLSRAHRRNGHTAYDFKDARTPLSDLLKGEPEPELTGDAHADAIAAEAYATASETRLETFRLTMQYFFADGPHPGHVMRRVYAIARAVKPELLQGLNGTDLAIIFDEQRASQSARLKVMFTDYLKKAGAKGANAPCQKGASTIPNYAAAQKGNKNRHGRAAAREARRLGATNKLD